MSESFDPTGDPRYFRVPQRGHLAPLAEWFLSRHVKNDSPRYRHSTAVGQRMRELLIDKGERSPAVLDTFETMGILHDVGYGFQQSGVPSLDGAMLLEDDARWRWLAPHLAWQASASYEYEERGWTVHYSKPSPFDHATLWVAEMTVTPDGKRASAQERFDALMASPNRFQRNATLGSMGQLNQALALHGEAPVSIP